MIDVAAMGELLIDFAAVSTDKDGYPTVAAHPGGAPANFLAAVTKCGGKTALLGKVGDALGKHSYLVTGGTGVLLVNLEVVDVDFGHCRMFLLLMG